MITWLKALIASDEILNNDDAGTYVPFTSFMSEETLSVLYKTFENYINNEITEDFCDVIAREVFTTEAWHNTKKLMANMKLSATEDEMSLFLEGNCYRIWFPMEYINGRNFNKLEKSALVGFSIFTDSMADKGYPYNSVHEQIIELKESFSEDFKNVIFKANIEALKVEHDKFYAREGQTVTYN